MVLFSMELKTISLAFTTYEANWWLASTFASPVYLCYTMSEVSTMTVTQQSPSIPSLFSRSEQDSQNGANLVGITAEWCFQIVVLWLWLFYLCAWKHQAYQKNINKLVASIISFEDERGDEKCILIQTLLKGRFTYPFPLPPEAQNDYTTGFTEHRSCSGERYNCLSACCKVSVVLSLR